MTHQSSTPYAIVHLHSPSPLSFVPLHHHPHFPVTAISPHPACWNPSAAGFAGSPKLIAGLSPTAGGLTAACRMAVPMAGCVTALLLPAGVPPPFPWFFFQIRYYWQCWNLWRYRADWYGGGGCRGVGESAWRARGTRIARECEVG